MKPFYANAPLPLLKSRQPPAHRELSCHLTEKTLMEIHNNLLIPMVVEQTGRGERSYDIYPSVKRAGHLPRRPGQ